MASDMVERVAEALWQAESRRAGGRDRLIPWLDESEQTHDLWRGLARAAIDAMREPTDAMCDRAEVVVGCCILDPSEAREAWQLMIDAALQESSHVR